MIRQSSGTTIHSASVLDLRSTLADLWLDLAFAARIFAGCTVYITALGIPTEVLHIVGWAALTGVLAQPCFALGKLGVRYTASMLEQRMSCVEKRYVR